MKRQVFSIFLFFLVPAIGNSATGDGNANVEEEIRKAWIEVSFLDLNPAYDRFQQVWRDSGETHREARLGMGVVLLGLPPLSERRLEDARRHLSALIDMDDEVGIMATYYLARAHSTLALSPDWERAAELFDALARNHQDHFLGQQALLCLMILSATEPVAPEAAARRGEYWRARGSTITDEMVRRNYNAILARMLLFNESAYELARELTLHPHTETFSRFDLRYLNLLRRHYLGVETGDLDLARESARRFVEEFPLHTQNRYFREWLEEHDET